MWKYQITGNIPSKKNSKQWIMRGGRKLLVPSDRHESWHDDASWQIKVQPRPANPLEKAAIVITIFAENMRPGDLTNKAESIMDLLVDMEILKDDNWFICGDIHLKFGGVERENPRAIIEINEHGSN